MPRLTLAAIAAAVALVPLTVAVVMAIRNAVDIDDRPCLPATMEFTAADASAVPAARTGQVLVANQFSETASIIDLATGEVTSLDTGDGPHDAVISPDGRWGVVSNFTPMSDDDEMGGNKLFVIDMAQRRVARVIETGEYRGLHDLDFRPGYPTRVLVTAQNQQEHHRGRYRTRDYRRRNRNTRRSFPHAGRDP